MMLLYPKDLTPASLAAIVEGVPVEAYPRLRYKFGAWGDEGGSMRPPAAALALIGSMTAHLLDRDCHLTLRETGAGVEATTASYNDPVLSPTLIQTLALACREVAK